MAAFYNEIDPFAAAWLRELIKAGHIAAGIVCEKDIRDIVPADLDGFTQCHFFAGIGAWSYALRLAGWPDDRAVWTGSCPCQPFSAAGRAGGFTDERHLWPAFFHLIEHGRPSVVFGEQVASKDGLAWLDLVQADMEGAGYAIGSLDICAAGVGAPHIRQRLFWISHPDGNRRPRRSQSNVRPIESTEQAPRWRDAPGHLFPDGKRRPLEPCIEPLAHGAPARVGRLRGYGNAIVAQAAAEFIAAYSGA